MNILNKFNYRYSIFLIFFIFNIVNISFAQLIEIQENWLCNDFGTANCLFEDVYGCYLPNGYYSGRYCHSIEYCLTNDSDCSIKADLALEIDGKMYFYVINDNYELLRYGGFYLRCSGFRCVDYKYKLDKTVNFEFDGKTIEAIVNSDYSFAVVDYNYYKDYKVFYLIKKLDLNFTDFKKKYHICIDNEFFNTRDKFKSILKDAKCFKKNNNCFLPQKEICLIDKKSKAKYYDFKGNEGFNVCVKWGIDLKEFSFEGFKNATFGCMEYKTVTKNDSPFKEMEHKITKYHKSDATSEPRLYGNDQFDCICKYKDITDTYSKKLGGIDYIVHGDYNNTYPKSEIVVKRDDIYCSDGGGYSCWEGGQGGSTTCTNSYKTDDYRIARGVKCHGTDYYGNWWCHAGTNYCIYDKYSCTCDGVYEARLKGYDYRISYTEPTFSMRDIEKDDEVYDPNMIYE